MRPQDLSSSRILYLSYDGLTDPLGQTQVVPYIRGLAEKGWRFHVISFEKPSQDPTARAQIAEAFRTLGVDWTPLAYHSRPTVPATGWDLSAGLLRSLIGHVRRPVGLIHARSYLAGAIGLALKRILRVPFLFDMRGFWLEQRMEAAELPQFRLLRRGLESLENALFTRADGVVSLTAVGKRYLEASPWYKDWCPPIRVIPTCVDLERYRKVNALRARTGPLTVGYVGGLGPLYLTQEMMLMFREVLALAPHARLDIATRHPREAIDRAVAEAGVPQERITVASSAPSEVPARLFRHDVTVALIRPTPSSRGVCATKMGESLAAGCPIVVNRQVGDMAEIVEREGVGVVADLAAESYRNVAAWISSVRSADGEIRLRCRSVAEDIFSLEKGVAAYDELYQTMLTQDRLESWPRATSGAGPGQQNLNIRAVSNNRPLV